MNISDQINAYIASQPEAKRADMQALHQLILQISPECQLWFLDGKNSDGKVIANPNIGYGAYTIQYADGTSREFYRIGLSATKTGISVYILGLADKTYLARTYGEQLGKAKVTGYCISFKALKDINADVLENAVQLGLGTEIHFESTAVPSSDNTDFRPEGETEPVLGRPRVHVTRRCLGLRGCLVCPLLRQKALHERLRFANRQALRNNLASRLPLSRCIGKRQQSAGVTGRERPCR